MWAPCSWKTSAAVCPRRWTPARRLTRVCVGGCFWGGGRPLVLACASGGRPSAPPVAHRRAAPSPSPSPTQCMARPPADKIVARGRGLVSMYEEVRRLVVGGGGLAQAAGGDDV